MKDDVQAYPCPLEPGDTVRWGPRNWFWSTIRKVGVHHWIGAYCYVPVEYQSGAYELIRVLLVDDDPVDVQIERVNPAKGWIRRGIAKSSKMPEITICEPGMLVLHVVDRAGAREDKGDEVIDWNITLSASIGGSESDTMLAQNKFVGMFA